MIADKHGIFRVSSRDAVGGDGVTQFDRALLALNIEIICANSAQAKGPELAAHIAANDADALLLREEVAQRVAGGEPRPSGIWIALRRPPTGRCRFEPDARH